MIRATNYVRDITPEVQGTPPQGAPEAILSQLGDEIRRDNAFFLNTSGQISRFVASSGKNLAHLTHKKQTPHHPEKQAQRLLEKSWRVVERHMGNHFLASASGKMSLEIKTDSKGHSYVSAVDLSAVHFGDTVWNSNKGTLANGLNRGLHMVVSIDKGWRNFGRHHPNFAVRREIQYTRSDTALEISASPSLTARSDRSREIVASRPSSGRRS